MGYFWHRLQLCFREQEGPTYKLTLGLILLIAEQLINLRGTWCKKQTRGLRRVNSLIDVNGISNLSSIILCLEIRESHSL